MSARSSISKRLSSAAAVAATMMLASPSPSQTPTRAESTSVKKGHLLANGVNYYYQIHGKGEPLLLLHGGLGQIEMFGPVLELLRRPALVSTGYSQEGFYPEMLPMQAQVGAAMADMMKETPMYKSYMSIAPRPQDFPKLLDRMGEFMRQPYDFSADVARLTMPVLLVYGDSDMFRLEHVVKFYQLLGGGRKDAGWMREHMSKNRLAILPNLTHYEIGMSPQLATTVLPFLNGRNDAQSWANQVNREN